MKEMFHSQIDWPSYDIKNEIWRQDTITALGHSASRPSTVLRGLARPKSFGFVLTKAFVDNISAKVLAVPFRL
jgi:hypothetical protein